MQEWNEPEYLIRRKIFKLFGGAFHVYGSSGALVGYTKMRAFKLKEDLRLYESEAMAHEILRISARGILDFGATYDVVDSGTEEKLGAFRRRGIRSLMRDSWAVLDANDQQIGTLEEDSLGLAMLRRFATNLIPQTFDCSIGGRRACQYRQRFNPFVLKLRVVFAPDCPVDRRLLLGGGLLLSAIEGRQE